MTRHAVLDNKTHRDLRIRTDAGAELGDDIMATLTVPSEFRRVQAHFPILFRRETGRDDFTALAMFGFQTGENLFLDGARWDAGYRPLRSDERRVGKAGVSTCKSRGSPYH